MTGVLRMSLTSYAVTLDHRRQRHAVDVEIDVLLVDRDRQGHAPLHPLGDVIDERPAKRIDLEILRQLDGRRIHRAEDLEILRAMDAPPIQLPEDLEIYSFGGTFINDIAERMERRVALAITVNEQHIYLDIDGVSLASVIERHRIGS